MRQENDWICSFLLASGTFLAACGRKGVCSVPSTIWRVLP
ncbi:lipoprotein [Ktedonobacter sp. SOSP1-52]